MNDKLISGQISYSTADIEADQFAGELEPMSLISYVTDSRSPIPPGLYRVIDGELFQVVDADVEDESDQLETGLRS